MPTKILFLAGSARQDSCNKKLAKAAYNIAIGQNIDASFIDLKDFKMPIYDGDDEVKIGLPETAIKLKEIFTKHDALFICSPEYNSSFSPLLKNTLDWLSRAHFEKEPVLSAYKNKKIALAAASPGGLGGLRGLVPLRMMLSNMNTLVLPQQLAISGAYKAFDDEGKLKDETHHKIIASMIKSLDALS